MQGKEETVIAYLQRSKGRLTEEETLNSYLKGCIRVHQYNVEDREVWDRWHAVLRGTEKSTADENCFMCRARHESKIFSSIY